MLRVQSGTLRGDGQYLHQLVRGFPELTRFDQRCVMGIQERELLGRVCAQIHLRCLDAGMAEPERDLADIAGCLKCVCIAQLCRSTCGVTCFAAIDGAERSAVTTCCRSL